MFWIKRYFHLRYEPLCREATYVLAKGLLWCAHVLGTFVLPYGTLTPLSIFFFLSAWYKTVLVARLMKHTVRSSKNSCSMSNVSPAVCAIAPSCWNQHRRSECSNNEMNWRTISRCFSSSIVSVKKIGSTIRHWEIAHHKPILCGCRMASWNTCGFVLDYVRKFCAFTYPLKWNHASSMKNVSKIECWSWMNHSNQAQKASFRWIRRPQFLQRRKSVGFYTKLTYDVVSGRFRYTKHCSCLANWNMRILFEYWNHALNIFIGMHWHGRPAFGRFSIVWCVRKRSIIR